MNIETALKETMTINGALGAALVDFESGMCLGTIGGKPHIDLELAAAGNTEVVRAKARTLAALNMDDVVEDMLITLAKQYHIIRAASRTSTTVFLYLVLDRENANLALARHHLKRIERELTL
jgi:predicted regulator of Ras-like GTPase activity (Roadblock/LC7/MglB family)